MKKTISFLFGWCVIVAVLLWSVRLWALQPSFYYHIYDQMDLADSLDVSDKDLDRCITVLLDYLNDDRQDIKVNITKAGTKRVAFDWRETTHMKDVKRFYQKAMLVRNVTSFGAIVLGIYIYRKKNGRFFLAKGYLRACFSFLIVIVILGLWILTDFTDFWIHFHQVFFTNNYWLLTPGVDFMIDMLPEPVFHQLVITIVIMVLVILGCACLWSGRILLKKAPIGFEEET